MNKYFILVRVSPLPANKNFGILAGAIANIFVCADSPSSAWAKANDLLEQQRWTATQDEEITEISDKHQFPTEHAQELYHKCLSFGIAAEFVGFYNFEDS